MSPKTNDLTRSNTHNQDRRTRTPVGIGLSGLLGLLGPTLTFDFTDEQWSQFARWLPETAREEFKECVIRYRMNDTRSEGAFKSKMDKLDERVCKKIVRLVNDPGWKGVAAGLEGWDMAWELEGRLRLPPPMGQLVDQSLRLLVTKLQIRKLERSSRSPGPGPKSSRAAYQLIADAAALLEKFTGETATRSYKSGFQTSVEGLCGIADPAITKATIDEALKRYIASKQTQKPKRTQKRRGEVRPSSA
jgi:hypothetical protein